MITLVSQQPPPSTASTTTNHLPLISFYDQVLLRASIFLVLSVARPPHHIGDPSISSLAHPVDEHNITTPIFILSSIHRPRPSSLLSLNSLRLLSPAHALIHSPPIHLESTTGELLFFILVAVVVAFVVRLRVRARVRSPAAHRRSHTHALPCVSPRRPRRTAFPVETTSRSTDPSLATAPGCPS